MSSSPQETPGPSCVSAPEAASSLQRLLERFFPVFCLVLAAVTFGYALYDTYQIDGDAIAYMDIGDYLRAGQWTAIVNGYWHPMYPAVLSLFHGLLHSTRANELHAYYLANFAIFLLETAAVVAFTDALVHLRTERSSRSAGSPDPFLLGLYPMRYLGLALLAIASQRELSIGKVRPDALLQALLLFALAALLRYLAMDRLRYAAMMGVALGCAYLAKSFAFLFAFLAIGTLALFAMVWMKRPAARVLTATAFALVTFGLLAGPYVAALSKQKGRLDFGDSGALNLAWYVGGTEKMHLQPYMTDRFGSADVHLKHPERELLRSPQILSYAELPYGTQPDWFDTTFWNEGVKPHLNLPGELRRGSRNLVLVLRYLLNHPEGLILLGLLLALGARLSLPVRPGSQTFWMPPVALGALAWGIYAIVNTEERYVTFAYLCIVLPLFAALGSRKAAASGASSASLVRCAAALLPLLLAVLAAGESLRTILEDRRQLSVHENSAGWYDPNQQHAAEALQSMGLRPGDTVACVGYAACLGDFYWARLAGLRILTEIYAPDGLSAYEYLAGLPNREQAIEVVRTQGAKVLVADFTGVSATDPSPALRGWKELGGSTLYELPLNLPAGTVPAPPPPRVHRKPSI
ncbi:MAG: hypothetical protein M3O02_08630 [Acidobacteriota bacterium]|nr:hypothetical protein [Acidobacteriota bacterium]